MLRIIDFDQEQVADLKQNQTHSIVQPISCMQEFLSQLYNEEFVSQHQDWFWRKSP